MTLRILIVEDDDLVGHALQHTLQRRGHTVEWATTVEEGETRLLASPPEVLLLDRQVFGRDGWSLREKVTEATRVVLMTGQAPIDSPPHYRKGDGVEILFKMLEDEL
jgi:two-component system OmpR family response regulator